MTALTEVWVAVKPDMDKFGPEVKKKLKAIDAKAEGNQIGTRFGVGLNGAIGTAVSRSAGIFAAGFAALKVGGFLKGAISQASDLSESASKVNVVFKQASKSIFETGKTASTSMGLSESAYLAATGTLGNLLVSLDLAPQKAAAMSQEMVKLAGDLASFNNVSPDEALEALKSGLTGEAEPLKRFGVNMNDATLTAEALKLGLIKTTKDALTPQTKALAAQSLIMTQTKTAQGDFARTSGGLANQQRILSARFADVKTSIGAVALPLATKLFGFLNDKGIPALSGIASGISGFTKSTGFRDFMSDVGDAAKDTFGFFKAEVAPRLQEFAGFVKDDAAPALAELGGNLTNTFAPAIKDVFGFVKDEVIPRLKEFGGFLGDNVLPKIGELATSLSKNKDFLVPFAATIVTVVAALKTWAIVQGILNVILAANPLGLIVIAIAAFVGGLVWAYKNSETFRDIVNGVFKAIQTVVGLWWNYYLKPIFGALVSTLKFGWEQAQKFGGLVAGAFNAIKEPIRAAIAFVWEKVSGFFQNIIDGAATIFGWVPGVGDKLKDASKAFETFRTDVNNALDGINDEPVDIKVGLAYTQALGQNPLMKKFATGGGVFGRGTSTSDSIPALLSNDEHVLTAKEVAGAGGHKAVESMRSMWAKGYAKGGVVLRPGIPSGERLTQLKREASLGVGWAGSSIARIIGMQLAKGQVNPGLGGALTFARRQLGKPYGWGAVGPSAYDCSGFMSAITNVILGRKPYSRLFATGNFPTSMFARGMGAFSIGSRRGNPGHMAGTLNGVDVESRGGQGVVIGGSARGAKDGLFGGNIWHLKGYAKGGAVEGDAPYDSLKGRRGLLKELGIDTFDTGGKWRSGTLGANLSGKTETVRTAEQEAALGRDTTLSRGTIADLAAANKKAFKDAMNEAKFRLVGGSGGAYTLQMTNG